VSQAAERIEAARLQFLAARGTPNESQAKATLRDAIDAAIPQIKCSCGETPHTRLCAITQSMAVRVKATPAPASEAAASDDADPQRLFDVTDVPAFTSALAESNRRTLETALQFRGMAYALSSKTIAEIADELARNAANIVLAMEIKK